MKITFEIPFNSYECTMQISQCAIAYVPFSISFISSLPSKCSKELSQKEEVSQSIAKMKWSVKVKKRVSLHCTPGINSFY